MDKQEDKEKKPENTPQNKDVPVVWKNPFLERKKQFNINNIRKVEFHGSRHRG